MNKRKETRLQRYSKKIVDAKYLPVELCTVNFSFEENLGFLIRAAACFGVSKINVIGSVPQEKYLKKYSGSLNKFVRIQQFLNPLEYLSYAKKTKYPIFCAEISDTARSIAGFDFSCFSNFHLVVGNEFTGIPEEIRLSSTELFIPMHGIGYCLNTSQTANIFLYEISSQISKARQEIIP